MDVHMASPLRGAVALTEEVRYAKLMSACRLALRNYVSVENMKRLANVKMEAALLSNAGSSTANSSVIRSERMVDFTSLYHHATGGGTTQLNETKLKKLLTDVGLHLDRPDIGLVFNLFDVRQNGSISIEEFVEILALTDYELDLALEKIRIHLLKGCSQATDISSKGALGPTRAKPPSAVAVGRASSGVLDSGISASKNSLGKNIIRENYTLAHVFEMVNTKDDGVFSLDEMMDLAAKVEVFLTEEEARKALSIMDLDGDDRIEEADFIAFMRQESHAHINKAYRVRESAANLRRWLVRGTTENASAASTASASTHQWKQFQLKYQRLTRKKFPGFLDAQVLMHTLANHIGCRLSSHEARELTLLVAPEKNGRIHQADLHNFMGRESRSFGELMAVLERDMLVDVIDAYRAHHAALEKTGKEDLDLSEVYRKKVLEIKKAVEKVYSRPPPPSDLEGGAGGHGDGTGEPGGAEGEDFYLAQQQQQEYQQNQYGTRSGRRMSMEVISIQQLKDGIEFYVKENIDTELPEHLMPNLEEWASLTVLMNADVAEGDIYGVRLREFIENMCVYSVVTAEETKLRAGERFSLDTVSRRLARQIYTEAVNAGKGKKPDYRSVFELFDEDQNGEINATEFKNLLTRLQLVKSLSDHQLPALIAQFSRGNKGVVKFEDFCAFAEKGSGKEAALGEDGEYDAAYDEDVEEEDDVEDMTSNVPPAAITRNADCDWLLWFVYREAKKVDPMDPEGVITELQIRCHETELTQKDPAISVRELWNIMFEASLHGSMTQLQFMKGLVIICQHGTGKEDDRVDYEAFCKYIIRMGRAFNNLVQQRNKEDSEKFPPMLEELKKYFKGLSQEPVQKGSDEKVGAVRYEKIFRRMDTDGDGMLTPKEFKTGLKRLHYKKVKDWNLRMVRRLFAHCDRNRDGLLSIKEFSNFVNDIDSSQALVDTAKRTQRTADLVKGGDAANKLNLSDNDEDDVFRRARKLTDHQLMRKVNDTLMDIVPIDPQGPGKHADVVRGSVRRFFQRADPEHKGTVTEERFRAFLRRSGLQDTLTASELRRLTEKLSRRGISKIGGGEAETVIDYERLCQQLNVATESIPKSRAETVMAKLQEAANASSVAGRSFPSLCSLVDLRLSGHISKEELIHTAKMMDCPLSVSEVEALLELLPNQAVSADGSIDYRVLQSVMETFSPRMNPTYDIDPHFPAGTRYSTPGALPTYATAAAAAVGSPGRNTTRFSQQGLYLQPPATAGGGGGAGAIATPLGTRVSTPYGGGMGGDPLSQTPWQQLPQQHSAVGASTGAYERILRLIVDRVKVGVEDKARHWGSPYSLLKQFQVFDSSGSGTVPARTFQNALMEIGVMLSPSDLQTVYGLYGRPEDNHIYYEPFCRAVEGQPLSGGFPQYGSGMASINMGRTMGLGGGIRDSISSALNDYGGGYPPVPPMGGALRTSHQYSGTAPYLHPRVLHRLRELKSEGNDPRQFFATQDGDNSGMLWTNKFAAVVSKLQLLQTDHQLTRAIDDFSSITNRAMVLYEDFLDALERALAAEGRVSLSGSLRNNYNSGYVNGAGYDGLSTGAGMRTSNERWEDDLSTRTRYAGPASSSSYYGGGGRGGPPSSSYWDYPNELEEGSAGGGSLSPPRVSDSLNLPRSSRSPGRYRGAAGVSSSFEGADNNSFTPRGSFSRSIPMPKASPSKVGAKMWGSDTPLPRKGTAPKVGEGNWCCAVCLYTENPMQATSCAVCDSPNYNLRKDYQVKEQCRNCTFLNGQFAEECEMCGEPLGHSNSNNRTKF